MRSFDSIEYARLGDALVDMARDAGEAILEVYRRDDLGVASKADDSPVTEADLAAHEILVARLEALEPRIPILSEEGDQFDGPTRAGWEACWIVDPLDGTREYSEVPRTDWAVHVALVADETPIAGAVALPGLGLTLHTGEPTALPAEGNTPPRMIVSRSRPPAAALHVAEALGADLVEMGSAGAKTMAVIRGECEIYAHSGGQYEWDSCAPVAVAAAAGCHVSRIDGSELRYNQRDVYLPDLLVCRPELADAALAALASFAG